MIKLIFPYSYEEKVKIFLKRYPELTKQYSKILKLLEMNPYHPILHLNHFKTNSFEGYSISINMSGRVSMEFIIIEREIILVNIGDYQKVYESKVF